MRNSNPWLTKLTIVMERDYRITGVFRGQSDEVKAPLGFSVNSGWKVSSCSIHYWATWWTDMAQLEDRII